MSKKPSHIPLFPDAYLRDNYRLTLEQHGLFLMLMMEAWSQPDCSLPDNDNALAEIAQIPVARFRKIAAPVLVQWTREDGRIFQKRLRKEWHYVQEKSEKARASVASRRDRQGYERNSNVDTKTAERTYTYGGGGGEGEGSSLPRDKFSVGSTEGDGSPFRVIGGGVKC